MERYDAQVLREYKSDVMSVLMRHEHWLPLSLPLLIDSNECIERVQYETAFDGTTANAGIL